MAQEKTTSVLMYKEKPLLRKDNVLYYGRMSDKYIVVLEILSTAEVNGTELPNKVAVTLQLTDPDARNKDRIVRRSEKKGIYDALDVGAVWLDRALAEKI